MHSRLNIPAPAGVKAGDLHDVMWLTDRIVSLGFGRSVPLAVMPRKVSSPFPRSPVPQTDTGGWVEYTKARERDLSKELGINSPVTSGEGVPLSNQGSQ